MKRFLALKASAGTGKTYSLALRYLALLFLGTKPYDIVAVTFTNKAAKEMRERVRDFLINFDDKKADEIAALLNISKDEVLKKHKDIKLTYLNTPLNIVTIDSFIQSILRKFVYFASLKRDFETVDRLEVFEDFIDTLDENEFEKFLDLALFFDYSSNSLKEFLSLLHKKSQEIEKINIIKREKPDNSKAKKAFERLKDYILNSSEASDSAKKSVDIEFDKIVETTWFKKESLREYQYFKKKKLYQEWFEDVLKELKSYFKEYLLYQEYIVLKQVLDYYKKYKQVRKELIKNSNLLSFEDIKHFTYELLQNSIEKDYLYFRLDSKIEHILIDEFQDTSLTEWKIFEPIIDEMASSKNYRSFFYVGDTKQAIYGFKGGMAELFDYVSKKYNMEIQELDVNYRSRENIVNYVNKIYQLEQKSSKDGGYVEVLESDDLLDSLKDKILLLKKSGVEYRDIAILVHTNKEVERVAIYLEEQLKIKAKTSSSKMVIHHPFAFGIIELMRYLHNRDITLHLYNFESVAKTFNDDIEIQSPVKMVKDIATKYNLWDRSVLTLLQKSVEYKDLLDFIENIDSFTKELDSFSDGIEVLTIHKSKGLAFKNVILLDKIGSSKKSYEKIIFDYEGVDLKRLLLRNKRESLDEDYKRVLEKEREKEQKEYRNLIYVALTRAEDSLIVVKNKNLNFLENTKIGGITPLAVETHENKSKMAKVNIEPLGKQIVEIDLEEEYKPNDYEAIFLGLAYHSALEISSKWAKSRYEIFGIDFDKIEKDVKKTKEILKKSFKGEFYKEIPFKKGDKVGIIDLLIKGERDFNVIDYKSVKPKDVTSYINQVTFYKNFIKEHFNKDAKGYLFFIDTKELKEV